MMSMLGRIAYAPPSAGRKRAMFCLATLLSIPKRASAGILGVLLSPKCATFCLVRLPQTPKRAPAGIPGVLLSPKLGAFCNLLY